MDTLWRQSNIRVITAARYSEYPGLVTKSRNVCWSYSTDSTIPGCPLCHYPVARFHSGPLFSPHINPDEIGLFGYSFGGGTTMVTVAGFGLAGVFPDPRVKAAVAMDGTDYVGFSATDYATVNVPLMLYQDGDGQNQAVFPQLVNSHPKYYADVSAALHISAAYPNLCDAIRRNLVRLESTPDDDVTLAELKLVYSSDPSDIFAECDASIFNRISDQTITSIGADPTEVQAMKPFMPLRKEVSLKELYRLSKWYVVSFFNKELRREDAYARYLKDSKRNQKLNPLIDFAENCRQVPDHLLDLRNGDEITFTPVKNKYKVEFSSGHLLLDQGVNNLNLGDDDQVSVSLPFSFSMPNVGMVNKINVTSNGAITISALTQRPGFEAFGSPWILRGEMLLNGQTTIAPLMVDLDPTAGGGIYAKIENKRVIVTWDAVPVYTGAANGAPNTIQVIINKNGAIEMILGDLANTGPDYQPDFIGNTGIASGNSLASELKTDLVKFTSLTRPVTLGFGGIYEQYYVGTAGPSCRQD